MPAEGEAHRHGFRVMGCQAEILWEGEARDLGDLGETRLRHMERLWSRFLTTSEISLLNGTPPRTELIVSKETFTLLEASVRAWELTEGRFDPTLFEEIVEAGYDRTFDQLPSNRPARPLADRVAPLRLDISLDPIVNSVTVGPGVKLDPGGIGKGLAADLVSKDLVDAGARAVLVNVGGDIRVRNSSDSSEPWTIQISDPIDKMVELGRVALTDGAVATSSILERTWQLGDQRMHHIIDPQTGRPRAGEIISVSAIASDGWWAEAVTKAAFVESLDRALELMRSFRTPGVVVDLDGSCHSVLEDGEVIT